MSEPRGGGPDCAGSRTAVDVAPREPSERVDVCVVGSGVAGALVAYSLASRGHEVVVLEAGERFDFEDRTERMKRAIRPEYDLPDVWEMGGERDAFTSSGELDYPLNGTRVKGVGGTTLHWLGLAYRLHEKDFEMETRYGLARDWPIGYDELEPYYAEAERELGVAGADDNPFDPPRQEPFPMEAFPPSYSDSIFANACEELGIEMHSVPQARNSEAYDGRSPCVGYSTCVPVCPSGAKYDATVHVEKAEANGARVIDRAPVQRLEHDDSGDVVEAAVYETPDGTTRRQEARQFVLACGGIETPRLLLLSASEEYPDGLANSSEAVGRYFMEHPTVSVAGVLDEETNQNPIGFHTSESHQFYDHDEPEPGSIKLEFLNTNPTPPVDAALSGQPDALHPDPPDGRGDIRWGDELLDTVRGRSIRAGVRTRAMVEQLPRRENRVTLDTSTTDDRGNPVPDISWGVGPHERRTMAHALDLQREIMRELDAEITFEADPANPGRPAHHMGTTRMGDDPDESVVDARLRTHDLENLSIPSSSVFVTSGAVNPTLTIAALALKTADHVDEDL